MIGQLEKLLAAVLLVATIAACAPERDHAYVPVLARPSANAAEAGSLRADFDAAARSTTLEEAASRWQALIRDHSPPDGEYEDEYQKNLVDTAKYELMRIDYLLGNRTEGDAVLEGLNPLQL
jgi:hypothetical protein